MLFPYNPHKLRNITQRIWVFIDKHRIAIAEKTVFSFYCVGVGIHRISIAGKC